ncbi:amidohydrolase family protein [Lentisalinibacter sediminis]|uniref:amidohydrolase family protein n=1 Tax=Lentisalinibacter sediminis TaxID=2992237 RepID=UPI003867CE15
MPSDRLRRTLLPLLAGMAAAVPAAAVELGVSEGTNIAVTASADGHALVFDLYDRLWRLDRRGGVAEPLTGPELALRRPDMRDDGTIVAEGDDGTARKLWLVGPDGSARPLTDGEGRDTAPRWYPDGRRVIFSSDRAGSADLYAVDVTDDTVSTLTRTPGTDELDPAVSASGRLTAWITRTAGRWELWLRDGAAAPRLVHSAGHRLSAPSIRPDDSVIVLVEEPPEGVQLTAVILSDPAVAKALARDEDFFRRPVEWLGRNRLAYTADGRVRTRIFGELRATEVAWTAWISPAGPPGIQSALDGATPLLHHGRYVIRAGRVFDGSVPAYLEGIDVVVEDDRIVEVGERRQRDGVDVLEFPDAVLMPGLLQLGLPDGVRAEDGPPLLGCGITTVVELPSPAANPSSPPDGWNSGAVPGPALVSGQSPDGGLVDVRGIRDRARRLERIREARTAGATVITDRLYPDLEAGASLLGAGSELPTSPAGRRYEDVRRLLAASGATRIAERPANPGPCSVQEQLRRLQRQGASAYEALRRYTAEAARLVGLEDSRGHLEPGHRADMLLVAGDPLREAADAADVRAIVAGGRFFTPAGLTAAPTPAAPAEVSDNLTKSGDSGEMSPMSDSFDITKSGGGSWHYPPVPR